MIYEAECHYYTTNINDMNVWEFSLIDLVVDSLFSQVFVDLVSDRLLIISFNGQFFPDLVSLSTASVKYVFLHLPPFR